MRHPAIARAELARRSSHGLWSSPPRAPERPARSGLPCILAAVAVFAAPGLAAATPTQTRLGGAEAQGPATRSLTALHHNPAMLAGMPGTRVHVGMLGGLDQRWIRRYGVDGEGVPNDTLGDRSSVLNPGVGYFAAASLYFEPFAIGFGAYDVGSQYDLASTNDLRWHLAPDPDRPAALCTRNDSDACRQNGGAAAQRTDFTFAVAWNILSSLRIGVGVHLPRMRTRFAYDNSAALDHDSVSGEGKCPGVENGECAERLGFAGVTAWLPTRDGRPSGFDLALTFGLAVDVSDRITLGLRYRSRPLLNGGDYVMAGKALVCRPDEGEFGSSAVQPCSVATPIDATLREAGNRELAIGSAFVLGRAKLWRIDANLYWIDLCTDDRNGAGVLSCGDPGDQRLSLVGQVAQGVETEAIRYRGRADMFGADVYTTYRARSTLAVMLGTHTNSPGTRRSAMTAGNHDAWRFGITFGMTQRIRQSNFQIVPGYGFDLYVPTTVQPGSAAFDPAAAAAYGESGADLNSPDAAVVLAGRGRPTNAGRYTGMVHTFMLGLRWSERVIGFD